MPAEIYDATAEHFSDQEMAALIALIVVVNVWNAVSVATRAWTPGSYEP